MTPPTPEPRRLEYKLLSTILAAILLGLVPFMVNQSIDLATQGQEIKQLVLGQQKFTESQQELAERFRAVELTVARIAAILDRRSDEPYSKRD